MIFTSRSFIFVSSALVCSSSAFALPTYPQALEQAKKDSKCIVVLSVGSDWLKSKTTSNLPKVLEEKVNESPELKGAVIWALNDIKSTLSKTERESLMVPNYKIWQYPAIQVVDDEGRLLYVAEGITSKSLKKVLLGVQKSLDIKVKRDQYWDKADKETGTEAVLLYAKGLDLLQPSVAKAQKQILEKVKKADPDDATGTHSKYTYNFLPFMEGKILKPCKDGDFDTAYANVDEMLKKKNLSIYERQQLTVCKFRIAMEEFNKSGGDDQRGKSQVFFDKAMKYLKEASAIAPKTEMGIATINLVAYYTQPVKMKGLYWQGIHNRPVWLPMVFDVSKAITSPGRYEIEFKQSGGDTRFRNAKIKGGSSIIDQVKDNKQTRKFTLNVKSLAGKMTLEVESRGTGWFEGKGDVIINKL